ncbi:MAG: hypothetical protein ACLFSY_03275 [Desulfonatronovibrionaceae bacterium]
MSIRKFRPDTVPKEQVAKILELACPAKSGRQTAVPANCYPRWTGL